MTVSRWITNLESEAHLAGQVAAAKRALDAAPHDKALQAAHHVAKYRQADVAKTMRQIEMETQGRFNIGAPMETQFRKAEEIAADGIIGIYREGAGDGA